MKKHNLGFSLIELLIVIVILGILAALAVGGLLASKRSANEGSAVSTMRSLHSAQMTYSTSFGSNEFAGDIGAGTTTVFSILRGLGLIDSVVGGGIKSGYTFVGGRESSSVTNPAQFFFSAIPISTGSLTGTGSQRFGIGTDGVIRVDTVVLSHYANSAAELTAPAYGN